MKKQILMDFFPRCMCLCVSVLKNKILTAFHRFKDIFHSRLSFSVEETCVVLHFYYNFVASL